MPPIRRPPRLNDRPALRGPIDLWHRRQDFYRGYRGERAELHRGLRVLHDAVMAYRLGDGDYQRFGHFVFMA